jgi:CubicO group peptidase (beta-lactamase class C family)
LARSSGLRRSKTSHGAIALYHAPEQFTDGIAEAPLVHEPGTTFEYSLAVDVLGRVMRRFPASPFLSFLMSDYSARTEFVGGTR